ncbi:anti-sigma factor family protein [Candidatus Nitrospira bockiana]
MTCRELVEAGTDYLEGALPPARSVRLHAHLLLCGGCRRYVAQLRATVALLRGLPGRPLPPSLRHRLMADFRAWKAKDEAARSRLLPSG